MTGPTPEELGITEVNTAIYCFRHSLLALPGTTIDTLKQVYSHPQALAQCERFLRSLQGVDIVASYDTAGSAKMIAEQRLAGVGAIASERAGAVFGLDTLRAGVQDHDDNTTRFLIVTRAAAVDGFLAGRTVNKTTIVFTLPNTPGNLASWIADPHRHKPGVNMPANPLSAEDLAALVAYLGTLK